MAKGQLQSREKSKESFLLLCALEETETASTDVGSEVVYDSLA